MPKTLLLSAALLVGLTACSGGSANIMGDQEPETELEKFAACITEADAVFYGTEWCPHCSNQKALFAGAMDYVDYVDCDQEPGTCRLAGITGYPTWVIAEEQHLSGTQPLDNLAEATGCEAPTA